MVKTMMFRLDDLIRQTSKLLDVNLRRSFGEYSTSISSKSQRIAHFDIVDNLIRKINPI